MASDSTLNLNVLNDLILPKNICTCLQCQGLLDIKKKMNFFNAITADNIYKIVCSPETWLLVEIHENEKARFFIHRFDSDFHNGKSKHGAVFVAFTPAIKRRQLFHPAHFVDVIVFVLDRADCRALNCCF